MKASLLIRRIHMYLALFFVPWIAMYSLSTLFFNHGIRRFSDAPPAAFEKESESGVATGLYMWWHIPRSRAWGSITLSGGLLSFVLFMIAL